MSVGKRITGFIPVLTETFLRNWDVKIKKMDLLTQETKADVAAKTCVEARRDKAWSGNHNAQTRERQNDRYW